MSKHFTHLHLHSEYSLLDGAISLDNLVSFGVANKLQALAITDHGNIFGAVKFFQKCKKAGIKPILGMEAYLTEDAHIKNASKKYYHLILLVQNEIGYKNLCKLISFSYQKGFYFKPRIDYATLETYAQGLIATTACLGGHIPTLLEEGKEKDAHARIDWFLKTFGEDRFYLEVQPEDQSAQISLNQKLYDISIRRGIPLIATGDCHYVHKNDREAHEVMLALQTHDTMDNPSRYSFGDCRVFMRTQQEMLDIFAHHESAIWNSGDIADRCTFDFQTGTLFFPKFEIPTNHTPASYFSFKCKEGFERLYNNGYIKQDDHIHYIQRLETEIALIVQMGFVEYFLIVSDFIQWAYRNNIPVGPGRGSAAGSLVSWALQITNIDPIKYNLLFERFLNPERISMPDIDIDFCIDGRDKVIEYVRNKYGHDKVCHIITFGTMLAKGVLKDVARALGFSFEDSQSITDLIPDQLKITLHEAIEQKPQLKPLIANNPRVTKLFDIAFKLEGLTRHASKHAAGIVICPEPVEEMLPVYVPPKTDELVAQYGMSELESIGFLKIDLLGLKNLTLIDHTLKLIEHNYNTKIIIDQIPLDDSLTFTLICNGNTSGVFQLESEGLKDVLRKLKPTVFEDIIAVNALYRPGPLGSGMVNDFIERKHGRQAISYIFPELEPILQETYGVIVYQEQVMKIASAIGGYSLGEADILRRAMGKKKAEVMQEQSVLFVQKAENRGFDAKKAQELFDLMAYFAGYGFNKSHSAAYALIAYQTAYLKANYPAEFMACLISLEAHNADKMVFYLQEAKNMNIPILAPNINTSDIAFTVHKNSIIFGLQGIKNVGLAALENIIQERNKEPFFDLFDFCCRIDLRTANKRVIENLICAGAFDILPGTRAQKYTELSIIMDKAAAYKKNKETGQMDLFGLVQAHTKTEKTTYIFENQSVWNNKELLEHEKEVIGFYLSSHPIEHYSKQLRYFALPSFTKILSSISTKHIESNNSYSVTCCGIIKKRKDITTKKGDAMSFITLEDQDTTAEIILFPKVFAKTSAWLDHYELFIVQGTVDTTSTELLKIKANSCIPLQLIETERTIIQRITCTIPSTSTPTMFSEIKTRFGHGDISLEFLVEENNQLVRIATKKRIALHFDTLQFLEETYGITTRCSL
ncbi:MAG TPA: DNA polymerase III subunit alpha [Candidatus Babeliales bacterium]|jgi:DNA polymerase-3 subunit alpha|nr:DNA polymerase III subunit alpha [Candidatus Babeliales bacterium]